MTTRPAPEPSVQQRTLALLARLAPLDGYNPTPLPDVRLLRANRPLARAPVLYEPGIVIVCQGRKRGFFGGEVYLYDAQHYLAVAVPVPFTMETDASEKEPLLAIYLRLDFSVAAELMLRLDEFDDGDANAVRAKSSAKAKAMVSTPMDARLALSVLRLLEALASPLEASVLGPSLVRELYFRVLGGEQGAVLRTALARQGHFGKVGKAIRRIHAAFHDALDIDQLAREAGMSAPSLHAHFKTVTGTSPMQYLKSTRLHQARLLMLRDGMTAAAACDRVGYESPSQFSREFKRLFGLSPVEEVARMKRAFALPYPGPSSAFVSSH
ncbi:AraC family transcriptional regulator [Variovorax sp. J22G73]|uniref:AraC family transcriptional regulator n=1 Tax=unclassified Variovorax TaxID=663243 RepID=UPI0025784A75|nr:MULTISPECIES: AraC family transcriptional regulator [unclassified Variovorax]MDM0008316.1 AraC family transcriptional regulator [Variovorax sp. J22R203]MDM0100822.1 AraC family transcriptional regulator [Variovorax sp. J22G73]